MSKKISRREALKLAGFSFLGVTAKFAFPTAAHAWSSVHKIKKGPIERLVNTHALCIDTPAYNVLSATRSFKEADYFPTLEDILYWEGSDAEGGDGHGPDRTGNSDYSEHYYNPALEESLLFGEDAKGRGPKSCAKHAKDLYLGIANGSDAKSTAKAAAWAAHYLADMNVPFHVIGCNYATLSKIYRQGKNTLPPEIFGDLGLAYGNNDRVDHYFKNEMEYYKEFRGKDIKADWFDPWYWNGKSTPAYRLSSHVLWEGFNHPASLLKNNKIFHIAVYHPYWENPTPVFKEPWEAFHNNVEAFAIKLAKETRKDLKIRFDNAHVGMKIAADAVLTLWRASISALKPDINIIETEGKWKISLTVTNVDEYNAASEVRARISVIQKGGIRTPKDEIEVGNIPLNKRIEIENAWVLDVPNPKKDGPYQFQVEVIGSYKNVPDAQYTVLTKELANTWPRSYIGDGHTFVEMTHAKGTASCKSKDRIEIKLFGPKEGKMPLKLLITSSRYVGSYSDKKPDCKILKKKQ